MSALYARTASAQLRTGERKVRRAMLTNCLLNRPSRSVHPRGSPANSARIHSVHVCRTTAAGRTRACATAVPNGATMNTPTITAVSRLRTTILVAPDIPLKGGYRKCPRERARVALADLARGRQSGRFRFGRVGPAHCCAGPPSEPGVPVSEHPAQASPRARRRAEVPGDCGCGSRRV